MLGSKDTRMLLIVDLSCGFKDVTHSLCLGELLRLYLNHITSIAKLTLPYLLFFLLALFNLAELVKACLAILTENGVSSCQFSFILNTTQR